MDSKSLAEQEKDIRDLLRRAERTPVKTSALRRDTLKRLIDLAHSPHPSLKVIAATNIKLFIKDFTDLEDDAINAVYDLCEDPVAGVRIKGYAAIVDVSREQSKWVKRNADVLVQLLQSDEPEEVTFVKRALTQHLDMDPVVTLGVLCDQIVPPDEPLDEEEQAIRDRIRSLVLAFLAGEAKRPLVDRHANALGSPAEEVLVSGLFKAITKLGSGDVDFIVKDVITSLPSFKRYSSRGKELLDILLSQVRVAQKSDIPSDGERGSFITSCCYIDLASFVTVERHLAHPSHLLRFYYATLAQNLDLGRLSEEEQAYIIRQVARTFSAYEEAGARAPPTAPAADLGRTPGNVSDSADDAALRRQFPDICAMLLQSFTDMKSEERRPWTACLTLMQGIARRKRDGLWQLPQPVLSAFERIESLPASQEASGETRAAQEQVHSVIRSLLQPVKPPASSADASTPLTPNKGPSSADGQKGNVNYSITSGVMSGDANSTNGTTGTSASPNSSHRDHRSATDVNKRKLDTQNGPMSSVPPSGSSGSRSAAGHIIPTGVRARLTSLPPRPSPATVAASGAGHSSVLHADRQQVLPHLKGATTHPSPPVSSGLTSSSVGPSSNGPAPPTTDGRMAHSAKKVRTDGCRDDSGRRPSRSGTAPIPGSISVLGAAGGKVKAAGAAIPKEEATPSLLSRLAGGATSLRPGAASPALDRVQSHTDKDRRPGRRNKRELDGEPEKERPKSLMLSVVPAKRRADTSTSTPEPLPTSPSQSTGTAAADPSASDLDKDPVIGFSIRGAAKAAHAASPMESNRATGSLLERLQAGDVVGSEWGRRQKRTKHS